MTYAADPRGAHNCPTPPPLTGTAWFPSDDGFVIAGQPNCSHTVFPSNDHPRDKASYDFTLTAPSDLTAVANGALVKKVSHGATTTWSYRENPPMATELAQIAVGHYTVLTRRGPGGVLLRDVVPTAEAAVVGAKLQNEAEHLRFMTSRVGPYPFGEYGVLAAPLVFGFALETQTLSLFPDFVFTGNAPEAGYAPIQVHELAHQWFGDDVSPEKWADVWLNEGHATWYEGTFADVKGFESFEARMRQATRSVTSGGTTSVRSPRRRRTTCSTTTSTTAARWCCSRCGSGSGPPRSTGWSGPGCRSTPAAPRAPRTSSRWRRRSPGTTRARS